MRKKCLLLFLGIAVLVKLAGEGFEQNIYGDFKGFLKENIAQPVKQGELWAIPPVPVGNPFLIGWELELSIRSSEVNSRSNFFMINFFSSPRPYPHEKVGTYRVCDKGTKILNASNLFVFQILDLQWAMPNQWQVIGLRASEYPLLLKIEPSFQSPYKETDTHGFTLKIKPIYNEKGIINFEVFDKETKEQLEDVKLSIEEKTYIWPCKETVFQSKGIYQVLVEAQGYEGKSVQVQVEPGRENYVLIPLEKAHSYLFFNVLNAVEVFLDGKHVGFEERAKGLKVEPGVHTLTFMLGSYKASRSIQIKEGFKYEVAFSFSFDCKELP